MQPTAYPVMKPSDIAAFIMFACLFLFICWVVAQAHKHTEASGNEFTFGCDVVLGFAVLIVLAVIAVVLLSGFQAIYPGQ